MTELSRSFGNAVRQVREERGWSQERLAEHADLNRSYVGDLERGRAMPSLVTLTKLAAGQLDIIVGTHRLLSKDVVFRDLGLLVVDEEQRFGLQPSALVARFETAGTGQVRT